MSRHLNINLQLTESFGSVLVELRHKGDTNMETALSRAIGWTILATAGFTAVMVTVLHVLQPELDPFSHAISEYVHGPYGFLMTITFFSQSLGSLALAVIGSRVGLKQRRARVGCAFLVVAALSASVAGIFPTDPTSSNPQTTPGLIHAIAGVTRFLSLSLALPLLSSALRKHPAWQKSGKALTGLAALFVITFLVSIFVLTNINLFGLGQRMFIAALLGWMSVVAYPMIRTQK